MDTTTIKDLETLEKKLRTFLDLCLLIKFDEAMLKDFWIVVDAQNRLKDQIKQNGAKKELALLMQETVPAYYEQWYEVNNLMKCFLDRIYDFGPGVWESPDYRNVDLPVMLDEAFQNIENTIEIVQELQLELFKVESLLVPLYRRVTGVFHDPCIATTKICKKCMI